MAWHGMFRVVPFVFSLEKSTPAGKKYTSGAGDAGDKLQLWHHDTTSVSASIFSKGTLGSLDLMGSLTRE